MKNGLYYTGDLGCTDEDGYLYVVGRKRDIIKVAGFRISAKEIEEALMEIDEIHEVAVIGVEDPVLGEAIKAFNEVLELRANDRASEMYIERCNALAKDPPPADCDGVFTMTTK